ncbi:MFS transporter [Mesorhizobium sp. BAC0120]|uniref:MFS transporter n=1 Tax=Mesorhizobium sp. BAC0120 TaxID=3090670 RepID=UPI00298C60CC|nr:MFS transporter [Mesorhizobium sp. BAC0120]MDW6020451.1 MFS transporter [Mesorhizobium sp. BAC0120]
MAIEGTEAAAGSPQWAAIGGVIATVTVFSVAQGLTYPLLSFILQRQGTPSSLIGLSAAMTPLGFIASSAFIPISARRFGAGTTALTCAGLAALLLALIGWTQNLWPWFPLRFLLGFVVNPLYVLSETWMLTLTPPARRGRVMGTYTSLISAGFGAGPLALSVTGSEGWPPFMVGIIAFIGCAGVLVAVLPRLPELHNGKDEPSVLRFLSVAPLLLFAVAVVAAFEHALLSLTTVYGRAYGSSDEAVSAFLTTFILGNVVLQIPLGLIAERIGSRKVLIACAIVLMLGSMLLPVSFGTPSAWPLAFVWGAASFGIYTMALVQLGDRFSGAMLVAGNAAFALVWGVGGIIGPPVTGAVMDVVGVQGLPLVMGMLTLLLFVLHVARRDGRPAGP